jgi:glycosyltransferase involved in cell wall biosynthesis
VTKQKAASEGTVDVVLLTKNSERLLRACIDSVYQNIPVRQLIVVDGYSTDQTLPILQEFNQKYGNVKIIFDRGNRATARQKGIELVRAAWFIFVDSDVILCKNWYSKAQKFTDEKVGAVWGTEVWSTLRSPITLKLFLLVTRKIFEVRGGTHDTLIRTSLVKDIKIPTKLHVFEDAYIKDWVEGKGYQVVACYVPFCLHFRPKEVWTFKGSLGLMAEAFRFGHAKVITKLLAAYGFYTVYSIHQLAELSKHPKRKIG